MTKDELIAFEDEMAALFNAGQIKAPLHLAGGNEDQLIEIFRTIQYDDWICCSWRSHYHCLLKGVPPHELKAKIIAGRSIGLCFPRFNVISSAIVGGIVPIALGIAWALKRQNSQQRVYCFIGDMTWETGLADEAMKYACNFELPIKFICDGNGIGGAGVSVKETWGYGRNDHDRSRVVHYTEGYEPTRPFVGTGQFVKFV